MNYLTIVFANTLILLLFVLFCFMGWIRYFRQRHRIPVLIPRHSRNGRNPLPPATHHLNLSTNVHEAISDSMVDGMIVLDDLNQIVDINQAARRIIQQTTVSLAGKPIGQVLPALENQVQAAKMKPLDIAVRNKESERFFEVSISPYYGGREQQGGNLLVLRDITERKKQENNRDTLTRTMVYDLRDPISNALFALEMLKSALTEDSSSEAQQLLDLTFASTAKTLQLVDKILEIGRLESGEMPLSLTSISLYDMVKSVLSAQTPRAVNKKLQLVNEVPESLPAIWADADLLKHVLTHLIDNSIKFTPGEGTIRVTAEQRTNERGKSDLLVSVSDTGPGIPTELQSQLFEQFVAGSHPESRNGLGLAFCKMALAAHGQQIWASDEPEQGATITFSLPISHSAA
jgi:PAS domain S-box-containing protein